MYLAISFPPRVQLPEHLSGPSTQSARTHQGADDCALTQLDFVCVMRERLRVFERRLGGLPEALLRRGPARERGLRLRTPPRLVRHAAEHDARMPDAAAVHFERG